jgi:hypothetical protein
VAGGLEGLADESNQLVGVLHDMTVAIDIFVRHDSPRLRNGVSLLNNEARRRLSIAK